MNRTSKKVVSLLCVLCLMIISSISVFALSDVKCTGGGGSEDRGHRYGILWLKEHGYVSFYHNVDRVWSGVTYRVVGHNNADCNESDFSYECPVGKVVGQG